MSSMHTSGLERTGAAAARRMARRALQHVHTVALCPALGATNLATVDGTMKVSDPAQLAVKGLSDVRCCQGLFVGHGIVAAGCLPHALGSWSREAFQALAPILPRCRSEACEVVLSLFWLLCK